MRPIKNPRYLQIALYAFFTSAAVILFALLCLNMDKVGGFFSTILGVISPFVYGFIIAYLVNPIMKMFEKYEQKDL